MTLPTRTAALLILGLATAFAGAEVVLLHNGSLLEGRIEWASESLTLHKPGGALRLRKGDVRHTADSALAVYELLRTETTAGGATADTHLVLADWAIVNSLWPQAARELLDARQLDPRSRRLELLENRLDELTRPKPASSPRAQPVAESTPQPEGRSVSNDSFAGETPRMPQGSLEHFTRRVQPIVLNGCATSGCHRGGEGDPFPLDIGLLHGRGTARATRQNLETVLAAIDLGSPSRSPLLQAARGPHAGVTPLAGPRQADLLAQLEAWVQGVGRLNAEEVPAPPAVLETGMIAAVQPQPLPEVDEPIIDPAVQPATYEALPFTPPQRGVRLTRVQPRDEFDPALFNERFRRPEDDLPLSEGSVRRP
ncbi:hypothetical protein MalM25_12260 [Planctomycetes bacterium MalM25]|nr:hypothetical protein MalM25_12260 [Planctomycetes bacterium MalM25]